MPSRVANASLFLCSNETNPNVKLPALCVIKLEALRTKNGEEDEKGEVSEEEDVDEYTTMKFNNDNILKILKVETLLSLLKLH